MSVKCTKSIGEDNVLVVHDSKQHVDQTVGALNGNSSKTATATDFRFDAHVCRDSPDMVPSYFYKRACPGSPSCDYRNYGIKCL